MNAICFTPARDLAAAIAGRQLSSVEVVSAFLDRIDEVDGRVNAITTRVPRAEALASAEKADEAVAAGGPLGPIHGLPIAVKDLMDVAGLRTTHGSVAYAEAPPAAKDSLLAERLRAGGAIFIGKTNTPEHGLGTLAYNGIFGPTCNPWNVRKNAGGSSGGAGAAVAAGMLPFADGSDSGGSIRFPAAMNNLVGLRCSPGRIPSGRPGDGWSPHGVLGPIARDAADAGLLLSALAGADPRAPLSIDDDPAQFAAVSPTDVRGLRIAWSPTGGGLPVDPEVRRVLGETIELLADAGAEVDEIEPTFFERADECWEIVEMLGFVEAAGKLVDEHRSEVRRDLARNVDQGREMSADEIARGLALRTDVFRATAALLADYDVLALPATPLVSVPAATAFPTKIDGTHLDRYFEWQRLACRVTVTAHPSLSVPGGFAADGMPVGLQLVGPHRGDLALLNVAAGIEAATGFADRHPDL
ncbi:MAG: amidase [Micromonosporaceae bacterium]|nr:amidase [Micromonosporaceae bacterium]